MNVNLQLTKKVDIWGFGVVVYQMTYGRRPFSDHPEKTVSAKSRFKNDAAVFIPLKMTPYGVILASIR